MKRTLYLGLEVPVHLQGASVDHCPLIEIRSRSIKDPSIAKAFADLHSYTHLIFTSKSAVNIFFSMARELGCGVGEMDVIAVGTSTAAIVRSHGITRVSVASKETAEGVVELLATMDLSGARMFWPHSALSRLLIAEYLQGRGVACDACIFYDTFTRHPDVIPDLGEYDEIVFTSPSTVDAFFEVFGKLPENKTLRCIGPVTEKHLRTVQEFAFFNAKTQRSKGAKSFLSLEEGC